MLAAVRTGMLRHTSLVASGLVVRPDLRQVKPRIHEAGSLTASKCREYCNLAVVHLPELSAPLPRYTDRFFAFLRQATLVDQQHRVFVTADLGVDIERDLV